MPRASGGSRYEPVVDANRTPLRAWLIFALAVAAYAVAVFQRASLGVASVEAQRRFGTTAAVLSLFSVMQLAVYAGLQVPMARAGRHPMTSSGDSVRPGRCASWAP